MYLYKTQLDIKHFKLYIKMHCLSATRIETLYKHPFKMFIFLPFKEELFQVASASHGKSHFFNGQIFTKHKVLIKEKKIKFLSESWKAVNCGSKRRKNRENLLFLYFFGEQEIMSLMFVTYYSEVQLSDALAFLVPVLVCEQGPEAKHRSYNDLAVLQKG